MSAPYPYLVCQNASHRESAHRALYDLGFCKTCWPSVDLLLETYADTSDSVLYLSGKCQLMHRMPLAGLTQTNSIAHMVAYVRRHNLLPNAPMPVDDDLGAIFDGPVALDDGGYVQ